MNLSNNYYMFSPVYTLIILITCKCALEKLVCKGYISYPRHVPVSISYILFACRGSNKSISAYSLHNYIGAQPTRHHTEGSKLLQMSQSFPSYLEN